MEIEVDPGVFVDDSGLYWRENQQLHPEMQKSFAERILRAQEKEELLLNFLASGEVSTTTEIAAAVIGSSHETARRVLNKLARHGLLKKDEIPTIGGTVHLFGLSPLGLASAANAHSDCGTYEMGRTSSHLLPHHLSTQSVRIALCRDFGFTDWVPEKIILAQATPSERRGKKFPDGLAKDRNGQVIAIEVERSIKYGVEWENTLISHWLAIRDKKYVKALYFTDHLPQLWRQFRIIKSIDLPYLETINFQAEWRGKFQIYCLSDLKAIAFGEERDVEIYHMPEAEDSKITASVVISRNSLP